MELALMILCLTAIYSTGFYVLTWKLKWLISLYFMAKGFCGKMKWRRKNDK